MTTSTTTSATTSVTSLTRHLADKAAKDASLTVEGRQDSIKLDCSTGNVTPLTLTTSLKSQEASRNLLEKLKLNATAKAAHL